MHQDISDFKPLLPVKNLILNQERKMHRSKTIYKWKQFKTVLVLDMLVDFYVRGQKGIDFFYWRKRYYGQWSWILAKSDGLKSKCLNDEFVSHKLVAFLKTWIDVLWITCALLWCFISCLDSYSDGTHSLQMIHCCASDEILNFSKSVLIEKQTTLDLSLIPWGWVYFQQMFSFLGELVTNAVKLQKLLLLFSFYGQPMTKSWFGKTWRRLNYLLLIIPLVQKYVVCHNRTFKSFHNPKQTKSHLCQISSFLSVRAGIWKQTMHYSLPRSYTRINEAVCHHLHYETNWLHSSPFGPGHEFN